MHLITFSLVVDDFGIKYVGQEHAEHLKASIEKHYQISCDWTGSTYCGLKLDWDYKNKYVDLSMPGYIKADLNTLQHPTPPRPDNATHICNPPVYGAKTQYIEAQRDSSPLTQKDVIRIQQLAGTLLYYARAVDPTLILPVNVLASEQTQCTIRHINQITQLLCHPSGGQIMIPCIRHDILNIHSDALYLSERKAKSRAGGFF
jgi:hypothetical protein